VLFGIELSDNIDPTALAKDRAQALPLAA